MTDHADDIDPALREALHRDAAHLHAEAPGLADVRRRHDGLRRRRLGAAAVLGAMALAGGAVGWSALDDGPTEVTLGDGGGGAPAGTPPPELVWDTVPATVGWFAERSVTTASGITYVLSTAPGSSLSEPDPGQALYRTSDGKTWETLPQSERWISKLAADGDLLYAVGTAPAEAGAVTARVGVSADGGTTWDRREVPLPITTPTGRVAVGTNVAVNLATGPDDAVVLLVTARFWPDLGDFGVDGASVVPEQDATGFVIRRNADCVLSAAGLETDAPTATAMTCPETEPETVGRITWADLGMAGPDGLLQQSVLRRDGDTWTEVAGLPALGEQVSLIGTPDALVLVTGGKAETTTYTSRDGVAWARRSVLPTGLHLEASSGRRLVAMDYETNRLSTSVDGGLTWNDNRAMADLQPGGSPMTFTQPAVGPLGFAVVAGPADAGPADAGPDEMVLLFSADGIAWSTTKLRDVGMGEDMGTQWVSVGADHIELGTFRPGPKERQVTLVATPKAP